LSRGPASEALLFALDDELPGARVESSLPHTLEVEISSEEGAWRLVARRPTGELLLQRELGVPAEEEATLRVVVFLVAKLLTEMESTEAESTPPAAPFAPPPKPGAHFESTLLVSSALWVQSSQLQLGLGLEIWRRTPTLAWGARLAASPPTSSRSSGVEAVRSSGELALGLGLPLLSIGPNKKSHLLLLGLVGATLRTSKARAIFKESGDSLGTELQSLSLLPFLESSLRLEIELGDPQIALALGVGARVRPLYNQFVPPGAQFSNSDRLSEGVINPLFELGLSVRW